MKFSQKENLKTLSNAPLNQKIHTKLYWSLFEFLYQIALGKFLQPIVVSTLSGVSPLAIGSNFHRLECWVTGGEATAGSRGGLLKYNLGRDVPLRLEK